MLIVAKKENLSTEKLSTINQTCDDIQVECHLITHDNPESTRADV